MNPAEATPTDKRPTPKEGQDAFDRFRDLTKKILAVPRDETKNREKPDRTLKRRRRNSGDGR